MSAPERLSPFGPEFAPGRHGARGGSPVTLAELMAQGGPQLGSLRERLDAALADLFPGPE